MDGSGELFATEDGTQIGVPETPKHTPTQAQPSHVTCSSESFTPDAAKHKSPAEKPRSVLACRVAFGPRRDMAEDDLL